MLFDCTLGFLLHCQQHSAADMKQAAKRDTVTVKFKSKRSAARHHSFQPKLVKETF